MTTTIYNRLMNVAHETWQRSSQCYTNISSSKYGSEIKNVLNTTIYCLAIAHLFNCASASACLKFGIVNYVCLSALFYGLQSTLPDDLSTASEFGIALIGTFATGMISAALLNTAFKTAITFKTAAVFSVACFINYLDLKF